MAQLILPVGLPGSGKTTYRQQWLSEDPDGRVAVNYDDLRLAHFGPDWIWNRKDEDQIKAKARSIVEQALGAGLSVIVDNTNLSSMVRDGWKALAAQHHAAVVEVPMQTPLEECVIRDRRRGAARVGRAVIDRMALQYGLLGLAPDDRLAIVDIDGTVADCSERLRHIRPSRHCAGCHALVGSPCVHNPERLKKNWGAFFASVGEDRPIPKMVALLQALVPTHLLLFVSGRPVQSGATKVGIITEDWLAAQGMPCGRLLLRQTGDHRPDVEMKGEILAQLPADQVDYVFEDRDGCVRLYRERLPHAVVMQVADGAY